MPHVDEYKRFAPFYDPVLNAFLDPVRRRVRFFIESVGVSRVLDVCCGTGRQLMLFHDTKADLFGLDRSQAMLNQAEKNKAAGVHFCKGDASRMGFTAGSFEASIISLALHEMESGTRNHVISEMKRVTAENGLICIVDYCAAASRARRFGFKPIPIIERLAGRRHHMNFLEFMKTGGVDSLLRSHHLTVAWRYTYMYGILGFFVARNLPAQHVRPIILKHPRPDSGQER
jgi:ubiquinone/menaquinone biosynthesis C-methylase UbiE